jgi:hypothetical protein
VSADKVHFWVFSSAILERQQLLTEIDAMLPRKIGHLNVVSNTVQSVTGKTNACHRWRELRLGFGSIGPQHRNGDEAPERHLHFADLSQCDMWRRQFT